MKMLASLLCFSSWQLVGAFGVQEPTGQKSANPSPSAEAVKSRGAIGPVSIIEVIGNPAKFNGKKIQVLGFMPLEDLMSEDNAIYLSRDEEKHHLIKMLWA